MNLYELLVEMGERPPNPKQTRDQFVIEYVRRMLDFGNAFIWRIQNELDEAVEWYVLDNEKIVPFRPTEAFPNGGYRVMDSPTSNQGIMIPADQVNREVR